jgi:hypothetical protein
MFYQPGHLQSIRRLLPQAARLSFGPNQRGNQEITHAAMAEYYGGLIRN